MIDINYSILKQSTKGDLNKGEMDDTSQTFAWILDCCSLYVTPSLRRGFLQQPVFGTLQGVRGHNPLSCVFQKYSKKSLDGHYLTSKSATSNCTITNWNRPKLRFVLQSVWRNIYFSCLIQRVKEILINLT